MSLPGGEGAGTRCAEPVNLIDLAPTFLQVAGVQEWLPMDGSSLLPCIEGAETGPRDVFREPHQRGL